MRTSGEGRPAPYRTPFGRPATRRRFLVGAAAVAAATAAACSGDDDDGGPSSAGGQATGAAGASPAAAGQPKRGGTTRFRTYQQGVLNYDVFASTGWRVHGPASFIYEPLVSMKFDEPGGTFKVASQIAESWEQPDKSTYLFKLRPGVKFQNKPPVNGRALTTEDVLYSFRRRMQPDSLFYGPMWAGVAAADAPDATTIRLKTTEPFVPFLRYLTTYFATVVAPEVERQFGDYTKPESAIGTGRWLVDRVEPDVREIYKPNKDYYLKDVGPYVDEHHEVVVLDDNTAVANFKAGELDYLGRGGGPPPELADELKRSYSKAVVQEVVGGLSAGQRIMMRAELPNLPYKDVRVRQALSLAIDRESILKGLLQGKGTLGQIIGPNFGPKYSLPIDQLGEGAKYFKRDVAEAKKLLAAAGYANGFELTLQKNATPPSPLWATEQVQLITANWKDAGIKANLEFQDYASFIGTTHAGKPKEVGNTGPGALPDPDSVTYRWYHPSSDTRYGRVDDATFTALLEAQRAEFEEGKRLELLKEIQRYEAVQQQVIYIVSQSAYEAWQPWIKGFGDAGYYGSDPMWGFNVGTPTSHAWIDKG
jgi:peptide/nickel transport system substrate-binding protein